MNEDWTVKKQKVISAMCKSVTKHSHLADDLAQWVSLFFLENEIDECNLTDGLIYSVAWKGYNLRGSEFKREHCPITFQFSDLTDSEIEIAINYDIVNGVDKDYEQALDGLLPVKKVWIEEIVRRNMSINLFSQHSGISRAKANERLEAIYKQLRDNARD